ncbi:hypothetical protein [Corticicoccus populi]|uniref:YokE-like PH domain-containing protein n=1 Tax=Corticicoccus populi TaxID=1812821 RepID=A0ABW5WXQ6_9STAP
MSLLNIEQSELYPTEKLGPGVEGTLLYKVGEQTEFPGAYITTNERMIMSVDMNGEAYKRVFSYQDIIKVYVEKEALFLEFPEGMGRIAMVNITDGDEAEFVDYVTKKINA